jgi:hypothetical protein
MARRVDDKIVQRLKKRDPAHGRNAEVKGLAIPAQAGPRVGRSPRFWRQCLTWVWIPISSGSILSTTLRTPFQ